MTQVEQNYMYRIIYNEIIDMDTGSFDPNLVTLPEVGQCKKEEI